VSGALISKRRTSFVNAVAILAAFIMIFSTINLSSSYFSFSNKALAVSVTDVAFGGSGFNFLNYGALQSWYLQCLASLGTLTGSTAFSSSVATASSIGPFIANSNNNGLASTTNADYCAQQLQSYLSQLSSSFQQCILSAMGARAGFSIAVRECALLAFQQQQQQQQQLQPGLQAQVGNGILNNGFTSTITNPSSLITTTTPTTTTTSPLTTNNLGAFQNLNPATPTTTTTSPLTTNNLGAFQNLNPATSNK
jgi:hypothetical protein